MHGRIYEIVRIIRITAIERSDIIYRIRAAAALPQRPSNEIDKMLSIFLHPLA